MTVWPEPNLERIKDLIRALKRGRRRSTGQHMDDAEARWRAAVIVQAHPSLYVHEPQLVINGEDDA